MSTAPLGKLTVSYGSTVVGTMDLDAATIQAQLDAARAENARLKARAAKRALVARSNEQLGDDIARNVAILDARKRTATRERVSWTAASALTFKGKAAKQHPSLRDAGYDCDCRLYEDVFTFSRWLALGRVVRTGEHASYFAGKAKNIRCFCRCQVEPLDAEAAAAAAIVITGSVEALDEIPF